MNSPTPTSRFAAPGRIAFREGDGGFPVAVLACRFGTCEISLYGAHVLSYRPTGHAPVLFISGQSRFERGQPIRGGVPVCWPWFGPAADPALPLHGFARILDWEVAATEYTADTTQITLALDASDATRRFWPFAFTLIMRVTLGQCLTLELTAHNRDTRPFTFSQAFHPYFLVRQIMDVTVRGLDRAPFLDRLTRQTHTQDGPLNIRAETDRIYIPQHPQCALHDPGIGRAVALVYGGASRLVVWNPWIDKARAMPDFGDDEYTRMICLEPANTDGGEITLPPGGSHALSLAIQSQNNP
jgi:glucose-6-phosphate 1-epimerase